MDAGVLSALLISLWLQPQVEARSCFQWKTDFQSQPHGKKSCEMKTIPNTPTPNTKYPLSSPENFKSSGSTSHTHTINEKDLVLWPIYLTVHSRLGPLTHPAGGLEWAL